MKKLITILITALTAMTLSAHAHESLNVVITIPAGTGSDIQARQWIKKYDEIFGTTSIVTNKPGSEGIIGFRHFASLNEKNGSIPVLWPAMGHVLSYNEPDKNQFEPLAELNRTPFILVARKDFPASNFKEYVAYAKANPGKVSQGMYPLLWEGMVNTISRNNNISVNFVPYNSRPEIDVIGGSLDTAWISVATIIGTGLESRVKVLATTSGTPLKEYPNIENGSNNTIGEWYLYAGPFVNAELPKHLKETLYNRFDFIRNLPWAQEFSVKYHTQVTKHHTGKDYANDIKSLGDRLAKTQQAKKNK